MSLVDWGWGEARGGPGAAEPYGGDVLCRVVGGGRGLFALTDGEASRTATVSGAFEYRAARPADFPVVGDFVACREEGERLVIEAVLPRRGTLSRKAPGRKEEMQLLAANVDTVFLVFALDGGRGFLPRLVERLMTLARDGGAEPVVLLNKADLAADPRPFLDEAEASAPGAEVLLVSAATSLNVDELRLRLRPGRTHFFLGKSGVGKSSLINALFGREVMKTGEVREGDMRGRHTTTSRELFMAPGGAMLLDSPGIREAALWADGESVDESFPEIAELARECRFADCSHSGEPGCAVQAGLSEGRLDYGRYESYQEFVREVKFHDLRSSEGAQRAERIRWKNISRMQRDLGKRRDDSQ
jgi:ribosome biogenesis GTPase / thiamine phosphate phosphatase